MNIEVVFKSGDWPDAAQRWAKEAGRALAEELALAEDWEVVALLSDDADIRKLNAEYRGKDQATNVLSWPSVDYTRNADGHPQAMREHGGQLGDLAFAYETCAREAEAIGLEAHFKHLVIHGVLHLLGYDHEEDNHAEKMEALEIDALSRLNIANPYEEGGS